jgi:uncharacterized protein
VIRGYDHTWTSAEQLMQDFAQAVIKIKGLAEMMATNGEARVRARMETMDASRSVLRAVMLDAEWEDFERKPTPMTGLPELLDRWLHRVSAAAEIPITLLFGMSPGGLNATADGDIEFFYNMIKTKQERDLRPQLEKFFKVLLCSKDGPTQGAEPEGWSFDFEPLWQMSDKEKAELRKSVAETDILYIDRGVLNPQTVTENRFMGDQYSMETSVDQESQNALGDANAMPEDEAAALLGTGVPAGPGTPGAPTAGPLASGAAGADIQKQALNGAQVSSALEIIKAVAGKEIPPESAQALLELAFQLDPTDAKRMLPPPGFKAPEPPPTAGPFGGGPPGAGGKPDAKPEPKPKDIE